MLWQGARRRRGSSWPTADLDPRAAAFAGLAERQGADVVEERGIERGAGFGPGRRRGAEQAEQHQTGPAHQAQQPPGQTAPGATRARGESRTIDNMASL